MNENPFQVTVAPILPSRDFDETVAFYGVFGFEARLRQDPPADAYMILRRAPVELHFFLVPGFDPAASYAGCYLRVRDVDALYRAALEPLGLPHAGIPRVVPPEDKPWGMREFAVVDPSGSLLRVGTALHRS